MRLPFLVCIAVLFPSQLVFAQTMSSFQRATGLSIVLDASKELGAARVSVRKFVEYDVAQINQQMRAAGLPQAALDEIKGVTDEYVRRVYSSWDDRDAYRIYIRSLDEAMTEAGMTHADTQAAIDFFATPQGKKVKSAISAASVQLSIFIASKSRPFAQAEKSRLMEQIQQVREAYASKAAQ